ncbi:response regulator [Cryobacterium sp. TMT1-2-2]|uniref:response regulator n=1 Tax=Cryobacterium sp. TMT1-2-2 TaxID=1259233 RepID=UPI001068DD77|nr:response regulator [Cryobacterium sp. TMT1-2-2]TFD12204.1 response regulator [Cryobacterium sp. TMT1-2-2]
MARILIVEDNPINMKLATLLVRRAGHVTFEAVDAESGLLLAHREIPDLILMDIQLPGMDGFAATAELKKNPVTAEIPVIALTAMAMSRDQERAREVGCDAYITKPLQYQELEDAINWLMPRVDDERTADEAGSLTRSVLQSIESHRELARHNATRADALLAHQERATPRAPGAPRILVAEDNPTNQKLIVWQLNLLGYEADMTDNGALAFARWASGDYDLVITDLHMPEMTGYELASAIRAAEPPGMRMPILAMTASAVRGDADHARMVGMDEYLMRPLHLAKLRAALLKWLPLESDR